MCPPWAPWSCRAERSVGWLASTPTSAGRSLSVLDQVGPVGPKKMGGNRPQSMKIGKFIEPIESMDLRENSQEPPKNPKMSWEHPWFPWFPVKMFPRNQSIDSAPDSSSLGSSSASSSLSVASSSCNYYGAPLKGEELAETPKLVDGQLPSGDLLQFATENGP